MTQEQSLEEFESEHGSAYDRMTAKLAEEAILHARSLNTMTERDMDENKLACIVLTGALTHLLTATGSHTPAEEG